MPWFSSKCNLLAMTNTLTWLIDLHNNGRLAFKGIVHFKMKIPSSFTHPSIFFSYCGNQLFQLTVWLLIFLKISSLVFSRRMKFIQVWNNLRVSKWWRNFHFKVEFTIFYVKYMILMLFIIHWPLLVCHSWVVSWKLVIIP